MKFYGSMKRRKKEEKPATCTNRYPPFARTILLRNISPNHREKILAIKKEVTGKIAWRYVNYPTHSCLSCAFQNRYSASKDKQHARCLVTKLGEVPIVAICKSPEILVRSILWRFRCFCRLRPLFLSINKHALAVQPQGRYVHLVAGAVE